MKKPILIIIALCTFSLTISACTNTARGVGEDMERSGKNIQNSVDK